MIVLSLSSHVSNLFQWDKRVPIVSFPAINIIGQSWNMSPSRVHYVPTIETNLKLGTWTLHNERKNNFRHSTNFRENSEFDRHLCGNIYLPLYFITRALSIRNIICLFLLECPRGCLSCDLWSTNIISLFNSFASIWEPIFMTCKPSN